MEPSTYVDSEITLQELNSKDLIRGWSNSSKMLKTTEPRRKGYNISRSGNYDPQKYLRQSVKELIEGIPFQDSLRDVGFLTSLFLYTKNGALQRSGFDVVLQERRSLPTLGCLPPSPDPENLFKEYVVVGGCRLLEANISKSFDHEEIVVCNPLTQTTRILPPLNSRRNPVLTHILVEVIVAGSSGLTQGHLSHRTEVFDSQTSRWSNTGDLPGPQFGLDEYQTGVCINGKLYCVVFFEDESCKGVVAYDVKEGKWLTDWKCTSRMKFSDNSGGHAKTAIGLSIKTHKMKERTPEVEECTWDSVPDDIQMLILRKLKYEDISRAKIVSRGMKKLLESTPFRDSVPDLGFLTSLFLYTKNGALQWSGFDVVLQEWRSLPTLGCLLPSPGPKYFYKEYLVAGGCGLLCANISKSVDHEKIVVCNPMTQTTRVLPPLNSCRNPVLMHILVDPNSNHYKVIVAGSSGMTQGHLSNRTEVFDSQTSRWSNTGDLPGPQFGLDEYQTGVCVDGKLYCVVFFEDGSSKGVVAYDLKEGKWLTDWKCPLPSSESLVNSSSVAQVVESDGQVYLYSEHEIDDDVEYRIDKMASDTNCGGWTNVVRERKSVGRGLFVYPDCMCVGFGEGKLCVFNTLELTGKVYDVRKGGDHPEPLIIPSPAKHLKGGGAELFHSLNPLSFTFQPNFQTHL